MRIVLDTNVLVSGLLSPFGPPGQIVRIISSGELTLCLDARILSEYAEVLARPRFGFDPESVAALLDYVEFAGEIVAAAPLAKPLPDSSDEPFLEVAVAAGAEHLVTGNVAHFPPRCRASVSVLSPGEFVEVLRKQ